MASYVVSIDYPTAPTGGVLSGKNIVAVNYELTVGAQAAVAALMSGYVAQPSSGTPSSTTFLRGDGTWATPAGGGGATSNVGVDTDGVPYFNSGATGATIAADTDGVPYFTAA
jgi:hypothetical protein